MAVLKILRNDELFATRELALANINSRAQILGDGEVWVATYGTSPNAKSLLAVKRSWGITIFDMDAVSAEIDSKIASAIDNLADIAKSGDASDAATTPISASSATVAVSGDNAADQIASLAQTMKSIQNEAKSYTIIEKTQGLPTNVAHRYKLQETINGTVAEVGENIDILKDSSLIEVYLGSNTDTIDATTGVITKNPVTDPQSMNFAYQLADGTYSLTKIDVSKFLTESEFADGLQVNGAGVVSVKVDSTSENFISVSSNGIKIDGIQDAIDTSIEDLDSTIGGTTVETGKHIAIQVVQENGVLSDLTIAEDDIASASAVQANERVIANALNDLETRKANKTDVQVIEDSILENVAGGNGINVTNKASKSQTISVKLDATTNNNDNILQLSSDGLYLGSIFDCGNY